MSSPLSYAHSEHGDDGGADCAAAKLNDTLGYQVRPPRWRRVHARAPEQAQA